jgi:hypothetical protein
VRLSCSALSPEHNRPGRNPPEKVYEPSLRGPVFKAAALASVYAESVDRIIEQARQRSAAWERSASTSNRSTPGNKYQCHHNAARDIRPTFERADFESVLQPSGQRSAFEAQLLRHWSELTFSAKTQDQFRMTRHDNFA